MFMSNKERKGEQEKNLNKNLKRKLNVAGGMYLLFLPKERINAFDNFVLHNVYTIRRVQHRHRVL